MTVSAIRPVRGIFLRAGWSPQTATLALAALACLAIYYRDAAGMASIWWHSSTFGHCLFIPFIIGWMVQQRLPQLRQLEAAFWWPGLIWAAAGGASWLIGDAASLALARHVGLVVMLQGAVLTALGPNRARALAFPLFYAFFLIPFGEEFVPFLQTITAHLSMAFLGLAGVPAHLSGVFISTPTGYFEVAEACSGAKFLIAMTAYATLVCNVCFKSWPRRLLFLLMALVIAVVANGVRAFGTIYVAHQTTSDFAVGFDHVVYGWVFFGTVLALVMAAGWPMFDRKADEAFVDTAKLQGQVRGGGRPGYIIPVLIALFAAPPLWSAAMAAASDPVPARIALPDVAGWTRVDYRPAYAWKPRFAGADHELVGSYRDARGQKVDLAVAVYAWQEEGRELVGFGQGAVDPESEWAWSASLPAPRSGRGERIVAPGPVTRDVMSFYCIDGIVTGSAAEVKLRTLKVRLTGGDQRAVAVLVSAEGRKGQPAGPAIAAFLQDMGPVGALADRSAGRN